LPARLVRVPGTRLFVDDRGDPDAPPLLFVHGGPGQGCYDFMRSQGDLLARRLRLIGVDQRGTLRSDRMPAAPALTADVLIDDFEALRRRLRIDSWTVLGHSAGAGYALRYVTGHVGAVRGVIFDCPCWDADMTDRHRLPVVARRLEELGQLPDAERCRELAAKPGRLTFSDNTRQAMRALGSAYQEQFFYDPASAAGFAELLESRDSPRSSGSGATRTGRCSPPCTSRCCRCCRGSAARPCCCAAATTSSPRPACWPRSAPACPTGRC
jgi:proline iminopeptidase